MPKIPIVLVGATGETGQSILNALVRDGNFVITLIINPKSLTKPSTIALESQGFPIDTSTTISPSLLAPFTTIISAIATDALPAQHNLAIAAKAAGVSRFVLCSYTTIAPRGGILKIRDDKEIAFDAPLQLKLPYTIVDVGFWHQISYPRVPSGKLDYSLIPVAPAPNEYIGDGSARNLLTDVRDVGEFVARIVRDPRTVNKRDVAWGDELSQKEVFDMVERYTGEVVERTCLSADQVHKAVGEVREKYALACSDEKNKTEMQLYVKEYWLSKYVKEYNSREMALYLGYLDARELYPDFKPRTFEETFKEVVTGNCSQVVRGKILVEKKLTIYWSFDV